MASIPDQDTDIVPLSKRNTCLSMCVGADINGILHVTPNTTLSAALIRSNRITAILSKIRLHDARRTILVEGRRVPVGLDVVALLLIECGETSFLGLHIVGASEARTPGRNSCNEAPIN